VTIVIGSSVAVKLYLGTQKKFRLDALFDTRSDKSTDGVKQSIVQETVKYCS
jgi:hypothetical protein